MLPYSVYKTPYSDYANQTRYWCVGDSEETYLYNLKNNYKRLQKYGWINKTIEYKFNKHGFRCDNFDNSPCIVFLGCSLTFGLGLPIENTFSHIVSKKLNLKCINLGLGGASNDTAYRLGSYFIPKLNTKLVVFNVVERARLEIIRNDESFHFCGPASITPQETFYKDWISGEANMYFNMQKNIQALNYICDKQKIKFITVDSTKAFSTVDKDWARDLLHPGVRANQVCAERVQNLF